MKEELKNKLMNIYDKFNKTLDSFDFENGDKLDLLKKVYGYLDETIEVYLKYSEYKHQCEVGCVGCCYIQLDGQPIESDLIIEYLSTLPKDIQKKIRKNLRVFSKKTDKIYDVENPPETLEEVKDFVERTSQIYLEERIPCPFLSSNKCIIYLVRPISCRKLYAPDDRDCAYKLSYIESSYHFDFELFNIIRRTLMSRLYKDTISFGILQEMVHSKINNIQHETKTLKLRG